MDGPDNHILTFQVKLINNARKNETEKAEKRKKAKGKDKKERKKLSKNKGNKRDNKSKKKTSKGHGLTRHPQNIIWDKAWHKRKIKY